MYASLDGALEQACFFKHTNVLGDRWLRDRKFRGNLADGERFAGQTLDDAAARGIREGGEDGVDIYNHLVI
ncbi:MAG TPA: hypothetical protein VIG51_04165 [Candidatus Baltobacteraceae bacterium]